MNEPRSFLARAALPFVCLAAASAAPAWLPAAHAADQAAASAASAAIATGAASAADNASNVLRATLANGLRVILVRNTLAPVVSTSVNYLVGSNEAPAGFPGMAHAQEHMMFRGSPGLTADQLADIGSLMGGNFNADTSESRTQYLFTVPSDDLDVALHIDALRMRGVDDSPKQWALERGAIEQEVARDLSNPEYALYTKVRAVAYAGTVYAHDALGTRPSFNRTTGAMLHQFYERWYAPNNAVLIVVGDLKLKPTLQRVRRMFGTIPRKALPARPAIRLRPMPSSSFSERTDMPRGTAMLAVRAPGFDSPDFPALEVLADVLNSHRFALYGLVPAGKALGAEFDLDPLPHAGLAWTVVNFVRGSNPDALKQQVRSILKNVAQHGVPADLVAAAKLQEERSDQFQRNSIEGLASDWSDAVTLYHLPSPDADLQRIEKVTVADVNRVARRYLTLDHMIYGVLLPQGSGRPVVASGGFGGQENITLGAAQPTKLPDWAQAAVQRLSVPALTTDPVVTRLPNGITLIVQPENVSHTVSVYGHIRSRAEVEAPHGQDGVAQLLSTLLPYGTQHLDRLAFERALDHIGAREWSGTDFGVQVLARYFDPAVALLAANELHPRLPDAALRIVRAQMQQVAAARLKSPGYLTQHSLRTALFPATDPSLREVTPATVRSLTLADVKAYYRKVYRPDMSTIVVIGDVTPSQAQAIISKYFSAWHAAGPKPATDFPAVPPNRPHTVNVPDASRVQDRVVLAQTLDLTRSNPAYYPLALGNAVLGGAFYSTRLSVALRKNSGLVYFVGSALQAGRTRSVYLIEYGCDPGNVSKAATMALQEIRDMQRKPAGAEELMRVKQLLLHEIPLGEDSIGEIANGFIDRRELGLPLDEPVIAARHYVELTAADVEAAFRKWLRPADMVRVTQGPPPG